MIPELFLADLEEKPDRLRNWRKRATWALPTPPAEILLLGMGSSHFANMVGAARLRSAGIRAVA